MAEALLVIYLAVAAVLLVGTTLYPSEVLKKHFSADELAAVDIFGALAWPVVVAVIVVLCVRSSFDPDRS